MAEAKMARRKEGTLRYSQNGFRNEATADYEAGVGTALSDLDLEAGDSFPEDSTYEIFASGDVITKDGQKLFRVSAFKVDLGTGSTWKELTGSRQITDASPNYVDWTITFQGTTGATRPVNGATYADVAGSGTLILANMNFEPTADSVGEVVKVTDNIDRVTVRFRGYLLA